MGWVTLRGKDGNFFKGVPKPFLFANKAAKLYQEFSDKSPLVRKVQKDEVFELLEGPRQESVESEIFLCGSAAKDSAVGWMTMKDAAGVETASPSEDIYVCRSTIAMTDVFDISSCQVTRKVDIGEALQVIDQQDQQADDEKEIKRLRFRAVRDGKEGWVTLKGNQGTLYAEPSKSHYVISKGTPL